jgi:spore maturation protein CgeB
LKVLCVFGQHNYGNPARGESYEHSNFVPALRRLGHEVTFFESWNKDSYTDFADLNEQLLATVQRDSPDVVLFVLLSYEIWTETLLLIRRGSDAILINWAPDDSWKYEQSTRLLAPLFDLHVTTYAEAVEKGAADGMSHLVQSQWAADAERLQEPVTAGECRHAVSFVGSAYGNRRRWIEHLRRAGIEVACFGHGWPAGPLSSQQLTETMRQSAISLNFADSPLQFRGLRPYRSKQIKARVFEIPGSGGLLLTEAVPGLERYFRPDEEILMFCSPEELIEKLRRCLDNPVARDRIARRGYERTSREHTYDSRFAEIFKRVESMIAARGTRGTATFGSLGQARRRHTVGPLLVFVRRILNTVAIAIAGRSRGPRAARKLVYEISWRLVGRRTYSASGLPGRLYYRES